MLKGNHLEIKSEKADTLCTYCLKRRFILLKELDEDFDANKLLRHITAIK